MEVDPEKVTAPLDLLHAPSQLPHNPLPRPAEGLKGWWFKLKILKIPHNIAAML